MRRLPVFLLIVGCVPLNQVHSPNTPPVVRPTIEVVMHGDTSFSPEERAIVSQAALEWNLATNNRAHFTVIWDLNFDSISSLRQHRTDNLVLRIDSNNPLAEKVDDGYRKLMGAVVHTNPQEPQRLYLLMDRLADYHKMMSVTAHELGHVLWLNHNDNPSALMNISLHGSECLITRSDLQAFCQLYHCQVDDTRWCQ